MLVALATNKIKLFRNTCFAGVVELVDTSASGADARKGVEVQVLSPVPNNFILFTKRPRIARPFCFNLLYLKMINTF